MKNILLVILFFFSAFVLIATNFGSSERVYDCGMAEWHPDIPKEVKDECRRMHKEDWDRLQKENKKKLIST